MATKISLNEAYIEVGQRLQRVYRDKPIPVGELKDAVVALSKCKRSGVLPSDRCYNRTNRGIWDGGAKLWSQQRLFLSRGDDYEYVGSKFLYSGPIWHLSPDNVVAWSVDSQIVPSQSDYGFPDEFSPDTVYIEGARQSVMVNRYERDRDARNCCITFWKPICRVCKFIFADMYGDIGRGFIIAHHVRDISTLGGEYRVDPKRDMRPVCPNCHAMLHTERPAMKIRKLKAKILEQQRRKKVSG